MRQSLVIGLLLGTINLSQAVQLESEVKAPISSNNLKSQVHSDAN